MDISITIMAHPTRKEQALALQQKLDCTIQWDHRNDEWQNGKRSLCTDLNSEWHCVLQDDAIIGENFYANLVAAIKAVPSRSLVSLYTGTVRPEAHRVTEAVKKARQAKASWLSHNRLLWGVAIVIPTEDIEPMLQYVKYSQLKYDFRIGSYFKHIGKPVYYLQPSIVDHNWSLGSLVKNHDRGNLKRVAHRYSDELITPNQTVISI